MQVLKGETKDGTSVYGEISSAEAYIEVPDVRFNFNPDFPQDAKAFFDAICITVQSVTFFTEDEPK